MNTKRIELKKHLTTTDLKQRYQACEEPVEKTHWQAIWLLSRPDKDYGCAEVADLMGFSSDWVRKLVRRYNEDPEKGLKDGRQENGNEPILSDRQQEKLQRALSKDPPDRGLWTGPKVAHWISQELNRPVSAVTGWHYLVRMGWSLQIPRRQHSQSATPEEQDAFKKNFSSGSKICARRIRTRG